MAEESKAARRGPWIIASAVVLAALLVLLGGFLILEFRERSEECEAWRSAVSSQAADNVFNDLISGIVRESELRAMGERYIQEAAEEVGDPPPGCDSEGLTEEFVEGL